ncbi:PREDICTED: tubby-related protein 4 isoform X2 [Hipposideros armiger]|uniref:Tubby-related protein 4 isoform X2 n=1 Tax=Hipposideros armiger TaxID=186990 RepID=A0A8B7QCT1_HIPAR|nr:PREDICTED: tubby-related protein 4 isoform X2 [Hipposideros armiger]
MGLSEVVAQWCTQGDLLAVAGMDRQTQLGDLPNGPLLKSAMVKFYNVRGEHIFTLDTLVQRPIISICWGHRDSRLLMASGPALYVVRVEHRVSSLQLLCQQAIASALRDDKDISKLSLPPRLCSYLSTAFIPTIKPPIPDPNNMRDFVSYPSAGNERLHCTMKRTEDDPEVGGPCYTLYLEYLGGLVPILKGRRVSKLRPEFVIMDPRTDSKSDEIYGNSLISTVIDSCNCSDSSDIELSDDWAAKKSPKISRASKSPKLPRINIEARKSPKLSRAAQEMSRSPRLPMRKPSIGSPSLTRREFPFEDITQHNYLAQVTSNIWGTKFKIVGLAAFLPTNLGAVIYKTSLLHLQPRQMTIYLPEVRKISMDYVNLPVFNPNVFSEDEDDLPVTGASGVPENNPPCTVNIPIAPIHSSAQAMSPTQSIGLVQSLLANQNVQLDVLTNQTTAVGAAEHTSDSATQYPISNRYSSPGQVIFGGVEMGRLIPNPPQLSLPPPAQGALQLSVVDHGGDREQEHLQKPVKALRPAPSLTTEGDAVVFGAPQEVQVAKLNPPPPYPGTIPAAPTTAAPPPPLLPPQPPVDVCLKKGDFSLYPTAAHSQPPLGYERITTFDSSGNVEEVCRPRTRMLCAQNTYALPGPGSSATLRLTATEKKAPQPCTSATLNRLTVPRYSIPTGDPPPYPDLAGPLGLGRGASQRLDSGLIHATLRRNNREVALKAAALAEPPRALPQHPPLQHPPLQHPAKPKGAAQFPARPPAALYTCSQCSAGGPAGRPEPGAGGAQAASTSPLASQSSYSLLSPPDSARERAEYVNSAFTEDEALGQHCPVEKPLRHPSLPEAAVAAKRPPPYQWDPVLGEDIWVPQERTAQTAVPNPLKLSPLMVGQSQHLDVSRVPFVSPKSPASPTATFQTGYGMGVPYPVSYNTPTLPGVQAPCSPKDTLSPTQFAQQEPTVVLQPAYPPSLSYCTLPPMYPGSSTCSSLQLPPIALHPWNSYSACPPVQNPQGTLPPKAHLVVEKPLVSPPPTDLQSHLGTEVMVETADNFQEVLSLTESPVPQRTEKFGKKSRKRLDSRAEEGNVQAITEGKVKKETRTLSDFNSLISSPRLGREKKKVKSQKDQLKSKKLNKTNEFQDSSESEPELFISGDELMNQSQGSKKGWKSKRCLRAAGELEEFKCRKASERDDGRLGSQGFVYVMANKQPLWNEATQVYQLDFGGRVTQESAKNFQIELEGRQVMQFGRIDGSAYILDFQYPFSAVQAFAVALANVTQRLK